MDKLLKSLENDYPNPMQCTIKGHLPTWLQGSLLRNGAGKFDVGPDTMKHWFDGMAVLHRYNIKDGTVTYQNKLLETETYKRNMAANRIVVTEFGTVGFPDPCKSIFTRHMSYFTDMRLTNNTVVSVMQRGDVFYALTETPDLNRFDPTTLECLEKVSSCGGVVTVHHATAHPLHDPDSGATWNLASQYGKQSRYLVVRTPPGPEGIHNPHVVASIPSRWPTFPCYSHSFGMTENFLVVVEQPLSINILKLLLHKVARNSFRDSVTFHPEETALIHIVKKSTGEMLPIKYTTDAFFFFHTINAFEQSGCIVFDVAALDDANIMINTFLLETFRTGDFQKYDKAHMRRFVIPLTMEQLAQEGVETSPLADTEARVVRTGDTVHLTPQIHSCAGELPRINDAHSGRHYRYYYALIMKSSEEFKLVKYDVERGAEHVWSPDQPQMYPGEPVFVASPDAQTEDEGVVLSPVISISPERPSFLVILDASTFQEIGRAEIPNEVHVPFSFHGHFHQ